MSTNKSIFVYQHLLAMDIAEILNEDKKKKLLLMKSNKTFLPSPHTIYDKEIVIEHCKKMSIQKEFTINPNNQKAESIISSTSDDTLSSISSSSSNQTNTNMITQSTMFSRFKPREQSRFNFVNSDKSEPNIEVPSFIRHLLSKKFTRYTFFKKLIKDDEDLTYFDKHLIREYSENNPWARFILSFNNESSATSNINDAFKNNLHLFIQTESNTFLNKFNSA